ncbi:hypothetical protein FRC11_011972 [Ceratobasidium sp. 423]|nr:hypothetical protein FRC11_011972 [Ceratobasidium sp. 423]
MPSSFDIPIAILRQTPESQCTYNQIVGALLGAFVMTQGFTSLHPPPFKFKHNGETDPEFAAQVANHCHACWGEGHGMYSKECTHCDIRIAAGWQGQSKPKKKSKSKQVNMVEVKGTSGSQSSEHEFSGPAEGNVTRISTLSPSLSSDGGLDVLGDFIGGYAASIDDSPIALSDDFEDDLTSGPILLDVSKHLEAVVAADSHPKEFLLDTSVQVHVSYTHDCFVSLTPLPHPISIKGIGGAIMHGEHKGNIILPVVNGGNITWVCIKGVIYAPGLGQNLISLSHLHAHGGV